MTNSANRLVVFSYGCDNLASALTDSLGGELGKFEERTFPDGESYLRVSSEVTNKHCIVVANLSRPNNKLLPLLFLLGALKDLGGLKVGLVAPYLSYMRQDKRFMKGEALTSKVFASVISAHADFLLTVDPHLHRYRSLNDIYTIPSKVVHGAPVLAQWLTTLNRVFLVGPDAESRQWVESIAKISGHPYVIGEKKRLGDREVQVTLPSIEHLQGLNAVIIDDVISSGHTILDCVKSLQSKGIGNISCAAIHGIFADNIDKKLLLAGIDELVTCNTIEHSSNGINIVHILSQGVIDFLPEFGGALS